MVEVGGFGGRGMGTRGSDSRSKSEGFESKSEVVRIGGRSGLAGVASCSSSLISPSSRVCVESSCP